MVIIEIRTLNASHISLMEFSQRILLLKNLFDETGHDYLLLVAHATYFLSKLPAPQAVKDTNLEVIKGIQEAYKKEKSDDLLEQKYIDAIKENRDLIIHYLNWEQTNIIEKHSDSIPKFMAIHYAFQPLWKWYFCYSFNKKESRINETLKMYKDMQKIKLIKVYNSLPK